jgi:hypothetical protein
LALDDDVTKRINASKMDSELPPGLAEQYDLQLKILRDDTLPDIEIVGVPAHMVAPSTSWYEDLTHASDVFS